MLSADERAASQRLARGGRTRSDLRRRARIILHLADGASYLISRADWVRVPARSRMEATVSGRSRGGVEGRYPGAVATVLTPRLEARGPHRRADPQTADRWIDAVEFAKLARELNHEQPHGGRAPGSVPGVMA